MNVGDGGEERKCIRTGEEEVKLFTKDAIVYVGNLTDTRKKSCQIYETSLARLWGTRLRYKSQSYSIATTNLQKLKFKR